MLNDWGVEAVVPCVHLRVNTQKVNVCGTRRRCGATPPAVGMPHAEARFAGTSH